jgi:hypothetical protein
MDKSSEDTNPALEEARQKKRKRAPPIEPEPCVLKISSPRLIFFVALRLIRLRLKSLAILTLLPLHFFRLLSAPLHVLAYRPTLCCVDFASTTLPRRHATAYWLSFASEDGTNAPE